MSYETFKWIPLLGASKETEDLIDTINLGDGVEQRQDKGLRKTIENFPDLKFIASKAEIKEMTAFLLRHRISPFYFDFDGEVFLVRKDGPHKVVPKGAGLSELSVSFIEVVR
ncbi:MAG: phage tail protein [Wohlfahrtiimonas sp.]